MSVVTLRAATPDELRAHAAARRWERENAGITIAGVAVATDDRSKTMIMGARIKAMSDPAFTVQWKATDGNFVTLDAAALMALSDAVLAHVDACFAIEAAVLADIETGAVADLAAIDAAFG